MNAPFAIRTTPGQKTCPRGPSTNVASRLTGFREPRRTTSTLATATLDQKLTNAAAIAASNCGRWNVRAYPPNATLQTRPLRLWLHHYRSALHIRILGFCQRARMVMVAFDSDASHRIDTNGHWAWMAKTPATDAEADFPLTTPFRKRCRAPSAGPLSPITTTMPALPCHPRISATRAQRPTLKTCP